MTSAPAVEIAVQDVVGARTAFGAGADRVEVCQALGVGGLTPSAGTVEHIIAAAATCTTPTRSPSSPPTSGGSSPRGWVPSSSAA